MTQPHATTAGRGSAPAEEATLAGDHQSEIDWIAAEVGFGNAATLRHHFGKVRGVSPQQSRRQFAC